MRSKNRIWIFLAILVTVSVSPAQQAATPVGTSGTFEQPRFGKLPLTFETNDGQTAQDVKFLSRAPGYTAFLTTGGIVLSFRPKTVAAAGGSPEPATAATVQFTLIGAAKNPAIVGEDLQPGKVNYFLGKDPTKWHTNVPTYARVRYKNIYPGIDLVYYGNQRHLEYDFEVQPQADPRKIQFAIQGASQVELDSTGDLVLTLPSAELRFQCPNVYQLSGGQRTVVNGAYVLTDSTHVSFEIADYDSSQPLVIDPVLAYSPSSNQLQERASPNARVPSTDRVLEYSTYLGGSGSDQAMGMAVDGFDNLYLTGFTDSVDFPLATLGTLSKATNHVFVAKLDPTGTTLIYADYIGGSSEDQGTALVLDAANDVYVTGDTKSSDFPVVNAYQSQQPGPYTGFLTQVSADGSALLYSTYLGGSVMDQPTSIAIDTLGEVHVAGFTQSQNFPVANAFQPTALANQGGIYGTYGFLSKFTPDGSSLVYSTYVAGNTNVMQSSGGWPSPFSAVASLAVDSNGSAYVTGTTNTYNFPVTPGAFLGSNSTLGNATVAFVTKFSSAGSLDYSTYFYGSSGSPIGISGIAVDPVDSAYITGTASSDGTFPITSTSICDPGTYGLSCGYAFVAKFDPTGSTLLYSTFLGPNNFATPQGIVLDANQNAYVVAATSSSSFQTNNPIESYSNQADLLLVEIDASASTQLFSTYFGGSGNDYPAGVALDTGNNIYVTGSTNSEDFPVTQGSFQDLLAGAQNTFAAEIGFNSIPAISLSPAALQFALQPVGSTSPQQQVQFRNMSSLPLSVASMSVTGDFAETNNCGSTIAAAGSCSFSVTFAPSTAGIQSGSIVIQDNAAGSPHVVNLQGTGAAPSALLSPASLTFPGLAVGTSSSAQALSLTNTGNAALNISNVQVTSDFAQTNNCPSSLAANASCTLAVTFTPTASGKIAGSLTISNSSGLGPSIVSLSGMGEDFKLSSTQSSSTVSPGGTATYVLSVLPVGAPFTNAIQMSCTGAPAGTSCSLSQATVTPGANPASVTLTIETTSAVAYLKPRRSPQLPAYALWLQWQTLGVVGLMFAGGRRQRIKFSALVPLAFAIALLLLMSACAGGTGIGSQSGTSAGTYTITVRGSSGSLHHSLPLTLTVQ